MQHIKITGVYQTLAELAEYTREKGYVYNNLDSWNAAKCIAAILKPTPTRLREAAYAIHNWNIIRKRDGIWCHKQRKMIIARTDQEMLYKINTYIEALVGDDNVHDLTKKFQTITNK